MSDDHHHPIPRTAVEERVDALEALLIDRGILDPAAIDAIVEYFEHDVGPMNGAKVVAPPRSMLFRVVANPRFFMPAT